MRTRFLPKKIDNEYSGSRIALYGFYLVIVMTVVRSLIHIFFPDGGAQSIATIPLHTYGEAAKATVIYMFATWGLSQLLMGIVYIVVALRYKRLIPLMYILVFFEYFGRILISYAKPIVLDGTAPGGPGSYVLALYALVMLILSLTERHKTNEK